MAERNITPGEVVKSSLWYTVGNFLQKGLGFLTLPIFARLMTKAELGSYSNFLVWIDIFVIVVGFSLESSINRARIDYPGEVDHYCSTILILGSGMAAIAYVIVLLCMPYFEKWLSLDAIYIHLMFVYLLVMHAYSIFLARQRIQYKYKTSVAITVGYAVTSTVASLILILLMQDKYWARSLGHVVPYIVISIPIYFYLISKGKSFQWKYVKYALAFCWPFVPHLLAMKVLNASDRIMITNMVGSEANATYTIANNCVSIATLFFTSLNTAVSPWVFDQLHRNDTKVLKKITLPYVGTFVLIVQLIQLAAPEVLLIVGGQKYLDARECFLPLFTSVIVQFCYAMYVNVEQYSRKTWAIAAGTAIAAIVNVVLNLLLIPRFGYVAAAYTTLAGYLVLFAVHFTFVRIIGYKNIYNDRFIFVAIGYALIMQFLIAYLYQHTVLRYATIAVILAGTLVVLYKNKDQLIVILKQKSRKSAQKNGA